MHHDIRLSRHPLDIRRSNSVPNGPFTRKPLSVLLGTVRNGDRHDATPDQGSGNQNPQGGVIQKGIELGCHAQIVLLIIVSRMWSCDGRTGLHVGCLRISSLRDGYALDRGSAFNLYARGAQQKGIQRTPGHATANRSSLRSEITRLLHWT